MDKIVGDRGLCLILAFVLALVVVVSCTKEAKQNLKDPSAKKAEEVLKGPSESEGEEALKGPFTREIGNCYIAWLSDRIEIGDGNEKPTRSMLALYEDGKALGPPHSIHADIRQIGKGAFSHWYTQLYFSTSDNSDPNTNGRTYSIRVKK